MAIIFKTETGYAFQDGDNAPVEAKVWLEKSKANEAHPAGKPWIRLPKGNSTNREYFSEDLFLSTAVDGQVTVDVKTAGPRVLGASGVKSTVANKLTPELAAEYKDLVDGAVAAFKAAKEANGSKKVKPEDMTVEQLQAYIDALKNGTKIAAVVTGPKSFIDMFSAEQYARYNEILEIAASAPKAARVKTGPLTEEQKAARAAKRTVKEISKAEALLLALQGGTPVSNDDTDEDEDADVE